MTGFDDDPTDSENFIPSSNIEPPPPIDYVIPRPQAGRIMDNSTNEKSVLKCISVINDRVCCVYPNNFVKDMLYLSKPVVNTQQDDFEDIRQSLSSYQSSVNRTRENSCGNMSQFSQIANPISGDQRIASSSPIQPPHLSTNRPDPTILVADPFVSSSSYQQIRHTSGGDFNSPRASQLDNVRLTSLEVRTSAPVTISSKREQCSSAYMASGESTRQDSCSSACSPSSISTGHVNAKTTNTTSTRTTRSGSDIFQSDSSEFHKPLLPPNKRITTVSTSTTTTAITDDQDTSPLFSYVLSLSVLRHVPKVERAEYVEFNSPDFVKTVAWRNRVQRMDENAESAVSDAAKILADAFADWLRESLVSESEGVHSDYNQPPATVVPRRQITNDARLSSSSSDCFDSRKSNILTKKPESRAHECQDPFESDSTRSPGQTFGSNTTVPDLDSQTNKKTTSPTPVTFETNNEKPSDSCSYEKLDVHPGALVYAKWRTDEYYYSGYIVKALGVDRYRIRFDDKSSGIIPAKDILQHALLPIGSNVVVDNSGRGEYEVGYVIVGHENRAVADPMKAMPSYVVKCIEDGREFTLERLRAAIHLDEVKRLSALGSVVTIGETSGCASMTSDHSQTPSSASSPCLRSRGVSSKVASADVSLDNIVYGKRSLTEKRGVLERAAPLSAPIRRGIRRKMPSQAGDTSTSVPSSPESCKMRQKAMLLRKGTSAKTSSRRHVRLSQRESQMWAFGRRVVANASLTSRTESSGRHRPRRITSTKKSVVKRQKLCDLSDNMTTPRPQLSQKPQVAASTMEESISQQLTQPMIDVEPELTAEPAVTLRARASRVVSRMSTSDANELTRLCRKYRIPVPCQDLFSKWAIVRTTGIQSSGQDSIHVPSTNPNVTTQLAACSDPNFLQLLILGGGGQLLTSIDALRVSATGRLLEENGVFSTDNLMDLHYSERPHIALVAPSHKRTLKFLQGLAALGRVPLLRGTWLLDACLLAAGMEPIMPLDQSSLTSTKKPADLPYELLRRSPRVVYELSRGVDRITDQLVVATEVPDLYAELPGRPHLQTLLSLGGYASASLIAIITDDPRGFGEGWSSILRLAVCTYENVPDGAIIITAPPTVLSSTEAMDWLTAWKTSCSINGEPMSSGPQQIVLVDQERVPAFMLSRIETLGFTVVNKEYLIQSLINGRMVDLKYATAWTS